jgi:hypothetical protein
VQVDRGAAERVILELELADGAQHLERGREDLRADAVAGQRDDLVCHPSPVDGLDCWSAGWRS